ncbi:MAG: hypothetical protein BroJett040_20270 [Oligoflexia bacterium]|nr:MAG: hypothetical protein BroJett040_20270 [Oligoflexia bacterium]
MKPSQIVLVIAISMLGSVSYGKSQADDIVVEDHYIRMMPPGSENTAAFMKLKNKGSKDAELVGGESDLSASVEVHGHRQEGNVFKMVQVDKIVVPAQGEIELKPGGFHIMFMKLKKDLKENQQAKFTLVFADKSKRDILSQVKKISGNGNSHHH